MTAHLPPGLEQALQASNAGDAKTSVRLLRSAIQETPSDPLPHFLLAAELAQMGEMEQAEAAYANTVLLAPAFETARFQLGLLQFTSGRPSLAMLTWSPLLELPDTNAFQHFVQGFASLAADHFDDAAWHLREGMALNQNNAPLNADMQKVLDRIAPLISAAAAAVDKTDAQTAKASHHVLLSNYQQDGPVH